jgi:DNA-binding NarL/FixJ family response regulator
MTLTITVEIPEIPKLTPRENTVLQCLGRGLSNKDIATALNLAETTARAYVCQMIVKTGQDRRHLGFIGFAQLHAADPLLSKSSDLF